MVARLAGAGLGLFAFAVASIVGLLVRNPIDVVLSRSILALVVFCGLGLLLGGVAELVLAERRQQRESEIAGKLLEPAGDSEAGNAVVQPIPRNT